MKSNASLPKTLVHTNSFTIAAGGTTTSARLFSSAITHKRQRRPPQLPSFSAPLSTAAYLHPSASRFFGSVAHLQQPHGNMDAEGLTEQLEEQASLQQQAKGRKPKGGKPGGRGGENVGGSQKREKDISRALSRLLRHQALNAGIKLDKEGYAPLDKVVSEPSLLLSAGGCYMETRGT